MAIPKQERQDIRLLKRKQLRWERRQITVEGEKAILELLKSAWITERIYFTAGRELSDRLRQSLQPTTSLAEVSAKDMELMTSLENASWVACFGHHARQSRAGRTHGWGLAVLGSHE